MAKVLGLPESEKEILEYKYCPSQVDEFKDIELVHKNLKEELEEKKEDFFDELPEKVSDEEDELERIRNKKKERTEEYDDKIKEIQQRVEKNKRNNKWFSVLSNYFKIFFQKYISKPWNLRKIKKSKARQENNLKRWKENPDKIFEEQEKELIDRIGDLELVKDNSLYSGAVGEVRVLEKLEELDDDYVVLCGLNIELDDYISYNGNHDLKSAQMDLVVVSRKGVFVIEVKNWSDEQVKNNEGLSPYEQVDRAGRVLYVFLESKFGKNPIASFFTGKGIDVSGKGTTDVLVSVQNNMSYDSNYKHVLVKSVSKLNDFITDREDVFKDSEVEKIVNTLRPYVTTK